MNTSAKPVRDLFKNKLLPATMMGSYPRPEWFTQQLQERDCLSAIKDWRYQEAFVDAVRAVITDQETAGLDLVTDGQMWFDDYTMGIGSFRWYWFERIDGFDHAKLPHPALAKAMARGIRIAPAKKITTGSPMSSTRLSMVSTRSFPTISVSAMPGATWRTA
jgi:methionine synthase II (cobalamin-independent)